MTKNLSLGVLISGGGTNLQALINACSDPAYPASISLVISNRDDAKGLDRARKADIKCLVIPHTNFKNREAFDKKICNALLDADIDLVCLAGFMRILGSPFVDFWKNRLINIHPSLLPSFKGLNTHLEALKAGVRITGCTVHFVRNELDCGPIIAQAAVPVLPDDTEQSLAKRVLDQEHLLYPLAIELIARNRIKITNDVVQISGANRNYKNVLINPDFE